MKVLILSFLLVFSTVVFGNGVAVIDASTGRSLLVYSSAVSADITDQAAITTTRQVFRNDNPFDVEVTYAFPMSEKASATSLRWNINGNWYEAEFTAVPQDTTLPGSGDETDPDLALYLGETPLYFGIPDPVSAESELIIELSFVELLQMRSGQVEYFYPADYTLIQSAAVVLQEFQFHLSSARSIVNAELLNMIPDVAEITANNATIEKTISGLIAEADFEVIYSLNTEELGLWAYSTTLPDSQVHDNFGNGFFMFLAEPASNADTIEKVFTLIIDRSGSMSGQKIVQAKDAARYIVNNLNDADRFNIVDFSSSSSEFEDGHVYYTPQTQAAALGYIDQIYAGGGTCMSCAFNMAIPEFNIANDSTANIIIFLTDGNPTVGITNRDGLLNLINDLVNTTETHLALHAFGIGHDVNRSLLASMANDNNGIADFLEDNELETYISSFYNTIRNPVLINPEISFSQVPVVETLPGNPPNLYKGFQLVGAGRYDAAGELGIHLTGTAFGNQTEYNYFLDLADSTVSENIFVPRIWAKMKIEELLIQYYLLPENSLQAEYIKDMIIQISLAYQVMSPFTSFAATTPIEENPDLTETENLPQVFELLGNYPNPFNMSTTIRFRVNDAVYGAVRIKIYNALGQLVRTLQLQLTGAGLYEIAWDGIFSNGFEASTGTYLYMLEFDEGYLAGKMMLVK